MALEKKSLISNRSASKKAIVTKPDVSKVAASKVRLGGTPVKLGGTPVKLGGTPVRLS